VIVVRVARGAGLGVGATLVAVPTESGEDIMTCSTSGSRVNPSDWIAAAEQAVSKARPSIGIETMRAFMTMAGILLNMAPIPIKALCVSTLTHIASLVLRCFMQDIL
jgi:hypothetical protein